tara:strand:+ start:1286 stop:1762 length:477 start_codon:yes stop_codon:yes gene_type:complete
MPKQKTKVGKFLQTIAGVAPDILELAGNITGVKLLNKLGDAIDKSDTITPEQKETALELIKLDYADLADARDLQKVALQQDDLFSKRFIYYLTIAVFSFSALIVIMLFFVEMPEKNRDVINFILGVVVGTGLTGIFQYFFGSSAGSKDKSKELEKLIK